MIYAETAPSDKSKCVKCGKLIALGQKRLVERNRDGSWDKKHFHCHKCAIKILETITSQLKE